jgi:hypothetical protein
MQPVACAAPRDIVALTWYRLGYRPRRSLVLVSLHGPRQRAGLVIRIDLPPLRYAPPAVQRLGEHVCRSGADAAIALVFSDSACGRRQPGVVELVRDELRRLGLPLVDLLGVSRSAYRSYLCPHRTCCPPEGRPLAEVMEGVLAAHMVFAGYTLAEDESALIADVMPAGEAPGADAADADAAADAADATRPDVAAGDGNDGVPPDPGQLLAGWRAALDRPDPDLPVLVRLGAAMTDVRLRDAVMLTLVPDAGSAPEDVLAGRAVPLDSLLARPPEDALLERARAHLAAAARNCSPRARADLLAVLAWLSWWSGDGGRGRLLADLAETTWPGHRLAGMVSVLLRECVPPPWVNPRSG